MNIDLDIDVSGNPELLALAIEGDEEGIMLTCGNQLGTTRQITLKSEIEEGALRCQCKPKEFAMIRVINRDTPEGRAAIEAYEREVK
jgi:hypothetical protein